jgi:hypothetical protein
MNEDILRKIDLGREWWCRIDPKARWTPQGIATRYLEAMVETIRENQRRIRLLPQLAKRNPGLEVERPSFPRWARDCARLRPLCKATELQWWNIGMRAFLETYPHPNEVDELRRLVRSDAKHKDPKSRGYFTSELNSKIIYELRKEFWKRVRDF